MTYAETYSRWKQDPEAFWMDAAQAIDWATPPSRALFDDDAPLYQWFADARVNNRDGGAMGGLGAIEDQVRRR